MLADLIYSQERIDQRILRDALDNVPFLRPSPSVRPPPQSVSVCSNAY